MLVIHLNLLIRFSLNFNIEQKKFEGTRVTVESFLSWKAAFDAEMTQLRKIQQKDECVTGRLTGLFS